MQVMWMVLVTLGLALGGILGLALLAHLDAGTRHRRTQRQRGRRSVEPTVRVFISSVIGVYGSYRCAART